MTSYIVTFGQLVQHVKPTDTNRHYGNMSRIMFVCLSVAFKFMNRVTDCYKSQCEPYDDLAGRHDALCFNCRHLVITKWRASELSSCE